MSTNQFKPSTPPEYSPPPPAHVPARINEETREEFGAIVRSVKGETASEVLAAQAVATIQARFVMAERKPRDLDVVRQRLLKACGRPGFAEVARYSKPIGQKKVTGLSVHFTREAARHFGNISTENIVIYDDPLKRVIRVQTTDYETNTNYSKDIHLEKTVERRQLKAGQQPISSRLNSSGDRVFLVEATEDDLLTKQSAMEAKIERQSILKLLPGDIQAECESEILSTLKDKAAKDPEAEKKKVIDAFDDLGIRVADLKNYLGMPTLDTLSPRDILDLRAVYQAVKEGETNWREVMEQRDAARGTTTQPGQAAPTSRTEELKAKLNQVRSQAAPAAAPTQAEAQPVSGSEASTANAGTDAGNPSVEDKPHQAAGTPESFPEQPTARELFAEPSKQKPKGGK